MSISAVVQQRELSDAAESTLARLARLRIDLEDCDAGDPILLADCDPQRLRKELLAEIAEAELEYAGLVSLAYELRQKIAKLTRN